MTRFRLANIVLYGVLSLWSIFVLLPMLWMVFASFKTRREIFTDPLGLPDSLSFAAYTNAWQVGLGQFLLNSAFVIGIGVLMFPRCAYCAISGSVDMCSGTLRSAPERVRTPT